QEHVGAVAAAGLAGGQVHDDAADAGAVITDDVHPAASVDGVVAAAAVEVFGDVGAVGAEQRVVVRGPAQLVEVGQGVGARRRAGGGAGRQVHPHGGRRGLVADAVAVGPVRQVGDGTAVERVVPRAAFDHL